MSEYFHSEDIRKELEQKKYHYLKEEEFLSDKVVTREFYISEDIGWFEDKKLWTKLRSIGYEKKVIKVNGKAPVEEERYFLCSFRADAQLLSLTVRRHWHIENLLHWVLDVTFKEDSLSTRNKKALHNLGLIRRFVLSIVKTFMRLSCKNIDKLCSREVLCFISKEIERLWQLSHMACKNGNQLQFGTLTLYERHRIAEKQQGNGTA